MSARLIIVLLIISKSISWLLFLYEVGTSAQVVETYLHYWRSPAERWVATTELASLWTSSAVWRQCFAVLRRCVSLQVPLLSGIAALVGRYWPTDQQAAALDTLVDAAADDDDDWWYRRKEEQEKVEKDGKREQKNKKE